MKIRPLLLALTGSLVALLNVEAGGLGPPPFTNGSPLLSGVEGTYQASGRGNGITGLIRFSYAASGNPSTTGLNSYIFFVEGTIVSGSVQASIQTNRIYGILNTPSSPNVPPTLVNFDSLGGSFNAKIDTNSPYYSFSGSGVLETYVQTSVAGEIYSVPRKFKVKGMRTSQSD